MTLDSASGREQRVHPEISLLVLPGSIFHIFDQMFEPGSTVLCDLGGLPAVAAETGTAPEWSDEEAPLPFWVTMSVSSGTLKLSSSEL